MHCAFPGSGHAHAGCTLWSSLLFFPLHLCLEVSCWHVFTSDEGMALHAVPDAHTGIMCPGPRGKDAEESWSRKTIISKRLV